MGRRARPDAGAVSQGPPPPASARQGASGPALRWPRGPLSRGCRLRAASARWAVRQRFEPLSLLPADKARSRGAGIKASRVGRASDPPDGGASLTFFARPIGRADADKRPALPSRGSRGRVRVEATPWAEARGDRARLRGSRRNPMAAARIALARHAARLVAAEATAPEDRHAGSFHARRPRPGARAPRRVRRR